LTQVHLGHSVESKVLDVFGIDDKRLSLSVETVNLVSFFIVEALVWEVLLCAIQNLGDDVTLDFLILQVVKEMVMGASSVVEKLNINHIICNKAAVDEGVRESLDAHCMVIHVE
jgi:hypothetical protein